MYDRTTDVIGPAGPDVVRAGPDGQRWRFPDAAHETHTAEGIRKPNPPLAAGRAPCHNVVDWLARRAINSINLVRTGYYALWSVCATLRPGLVPHWVAVLRALWCHGCDSQPACEALVWDEGTADFYCGGANGGRGCGCGQTRLSKWWTMIRLAGSTCPLNKWGVDDKVKHPGFKHNDDDSDTLDR